MQLSRHSQPFDSDDFIYELKIDGFRALAHLKEGQGELVSRNGNRFLLTGLRVKVGVDFGAIAHQFATLFGASAVPIGPGCKRSVTSLIDKKSCGFPNAPRTEEHGVKTCRKQITAVLSILTIVT